MIIFWIKQVKNAIEIEDILRNADDLFVF